MTYSPEIEASRKRMMQLQADLAAGKDEAQAARDNGFMTANDLARKVAQVRKDAGYDR